jgi:hypothetical protein
VPSVRDVVQMKKKTPIATRAENKLFRGSVRRGCIFQQVCPLLARARPQPSTAGWKNMNIYCIAKRAANSACKAKPISERRNLSAAKLNRNLRAAGERRHHYKLSTFLLIILAALVADFHIFKKRLSKVGDDLEWGNVGAI